MEIDCELLINEVGKYPVIYNPMNEDFKNRTAKIKAWRKVTEAVVGELYQALDGQEQYDIGKGIEKKWKTLKDAYTRSLRIQAMKSGSSAFKRRPYFYHQQMSFLNPTIKNARPTTSPGEVNTKAKRNEDDAQVSKDDPLPIVLYAMNEKESSETEFNLLMVNQASSTQTLEPSRDDPPPALIPTVPGTMKTRESSDTQLNLLKVNQASSNQTLERSRDDPTVPGTMKTRESSETQLNLLKVNQASSNQDNDPDKLFLLSLAPKMKALNFAASLDFQIKVMQLLQGYLSDSKNLLNQPSNKHF